MTTAVVCGLAAGALGARMAAAASATARLVSGQSFRAELVCIEPDGTIRWRASDGAPQSVSREMLVCWGQWREPRRGPRLLLRGGGVLAAAPTAIAEEELAAQSDLWGAVRLPFSSLHGVLLRPPLDLWRRDQLADRIAAGGGVQDRLWLDNGDTVAGWLLPSRPNQASPFGLNALTLQRAGGDLVAPARRVTAIALAGPPAEPLAAGGGAIWLGFQDGSLLPVQRIGRAGGAVALTLPGRVTLQTDARRLWPQVSLIQPLGGSRVAYLSDLAAAGYRHEPFLETTWPYGRDRNARGGRLRAGGATYLKGLGVRSAARLTYVVPDGVARLEAELAIDDEADAAGSVVFRVYRQDGDDQPWRLVCEQGVVRAGQPPQGLAADVAGAGRVALVADYADRGDVGDLADWLNARLVSP